MDPPAAAAAGGLLGSDGTRRHRSPARCAAAGPGCSSESCTTDYGPVRTRRAQRSSGHVLNGNTGSVVVGSGRLHLRPRGAGGDCGHGVLVLAGGPPPRLPVAARGECTMALAGGVTVMANPGFVRSSAGSAGSPPTGDARPFRRLRRRRSAGGEGAGHARGGTVVRRPPHGHPVLAVIRGSAVNQDGASNGLTAPNGPSQQRVIRQALANAGLEPADIDAVEAHGTGTRLGDPIEAQALLATYGQNRTRPTPVARLRQIQHRPHPSRRRSRRRHQNGHGMHHDTLPPTLHIDQPTPHVDWTTGAVRLAHRTTTMAPEPNPAEPRVSSFGISGTNAHAIIEEAPGTVPMARSGTALRAWPFVLSARSPEALWEQANRLIPVVGRHSLGDLACSLATTRATFEHRAVVVAGDRDTLVSGLQSIRATTPGSRVGYMFTGQGAQRAGIGRELYDQFPSYANAFDDVVAAVDPALRDVVFGTVEGLDQGHRGPNRRSSPWKWRCTGCSSPGASPPMSYWATPSARSRPRTSPGCCP